MNIQHLYKLHKVRYCCSARTDSPSASHMYLGMQEKYNLQLPEYPDAQQCVRLDNTGGQGGKHDPSAMRLNYDVGGLQEEDVDEDPMKQFDRSAVVQKGGVLCERRGGRERAAS